MMIKSFSLRGVRDMVDALLFSLLRVKELGGLLAVAGILFVWPVGAEAQSQEAYNPHSDSEPRQGRFDGEFSPSTSPTNLPAWAEPSAESFQTESRSSGPSLGEQGVEPNAPPPPPPDPPPVPVDGGLSLLAAAGAGYALRKLNEEDEEDSPA